MNAKDFKSTTGKAKGTVHVFESKEDFGAIRQVEEFLEERGYSLGTMCRDEPMGVKRGEYNIAKWYNLSSSDRKQLDGLVVGEKRNGPVTLIFAKED